MKVGKENKSYADLDVCWEIVGRVPIKTHCEMQMGAMECGTVRQPRWFAYQDLDVKFALRHFLPLHVRVTLWSHYSQSHSYKLWHQPDRIFVSCVHCHRNYNRILLPVTG